MAQLQTLQIFSNAFEAEILRTRLDAEGIPCVVNGSEVATMLSHMGSAVAKVRLQVAASDFDRAKQILASDEIDRIDSTAWVCARCDERNEPLFDLCWNCGKERDDNDAVAANIEIEFAPAAPFRTTSEIDPLPRKPIDTNPFAAPPIRRASDFDDAADESIDPDFPGHHPGLVDEVNRIFRGAVIGLVFAPPLLSIYVMLRMISQVPADAYRNPRLRSVLVTAWILCLLSIFLAIGIYSLLF